MNNILKNIYVTTVNLWQTGQNRTNWLQLQASSHKLITKINHANQYV